MDQRNAVNYNPHYTNHETSPRSLQKICQLNLTSANFQHQEMNKFLTIQVWVEIPATIKNA